MAQSDAPQTRIELATYIVERAKAMGAKVSESSRLIQMQRVLERGYVPFDDPQFPIALESLRDFYQLRLIVDHLEAQGAGPDFREHVRRLLKDAALPQITSENTPGRDIQFQLYIAAICSRAGMLPISHEEPDVTCVVEGTKFGVAAKRLKRMKQLLYHVGKGAEQILRSGNPGIIALDLTIARNEANDPIISRIQSQWASLIVDAKNDNLFKEHSEEIFRKVANTGVRALLVFDFALRLTPNDTWVHEGNMCWLPTTQDNEQASRELEQFEKGFLRGMPGLKAE